jgi:CBS domain containing-hemolysin-like protein
MTIIDILYAISIIFLIYASAYISAAEIALFSLPPAKIKAYQYEKNPTKRLIAKLVMRSLDLIVTVFIVNTLINILLQNVFSNFFANNSWWLKVGVPLFLILFLGEILPKYTAMLKNEKIALHIAPTINILMNLLKPIRQLVVDITIPISRVLFFFLRKSETISEDELIHVLKTSEETGIIKPEEADLVSGFITLQNAQVKELMWPREDVLFYDINEPLSKLTYLFADQQCTRLPVCDNDLDHVLGIINATQYLIHREKIQDPIDLKPWLSKPFYLPENTSADVLFKRFEEKDEYLALVVNEYGVVTGLVTSEDVVEEIIGDIIDRRDQNPLYTRPSDNVIIASGKLELSEFNDIFGVSLESPNNMLTIGGWLIEQLGDIPKSGRKFENDLFLFHVLSSEPNRVKKIYIRKKL